jgi:hypothetical protein
MKRHKDHEEQKTLARKFLFIVEINVSKEGNKGAEMLEKLMLKKRSLDKTQPEKDEKTAKYNDPKTIHMPIVYYTIRVTVVFRSLSSLPSKALPKRRSIFLLKASPRVRSEGGKPPARLHEIDN